MGCTQSVEAAVGAVYDVSGSVVDVSSVVVDVSGSVVDVSGSVVDVSGSDVSGSVVDVSGSDVSGSVVDVSGSVATALEDLKEPTPPVTPVSLPVTQGSVSPDPEPSTPAPLQTDGLL